MAGICEALISKKLTYTPLTNKWIFSLEMFAITYFTELLVHPSRKVIDLTKIPQDIRAALCRSLDKFGDGINTLMLGTGSGGVVPEAFSETVMTGDKEIVDLYYLMPSKCIPSKFRIKNTY